MSRKPRIAIVGLGMGIKPHALGLAELTDRVEVAYAFSPSAARREAFAATYGFPTCEGIETILDDKTVEAALVATPPNTHMDVAATVARAGKHVLLEKPVEVTTERAEALVRICREAGVTLGIVLQHRFRPAAERLASMLRSGELGDIYGCSCQIRLWRPQSYYDEPGRGLLSRDGGGVLITQGIHTLDLMLSLAGPVDEVSAFVTTSPAHRMETEDLVAASMRFANGAIGTLDATTAAYPGFPERILLACTKGSAQLAGTSLTVQFTDGRTEEMKPDSTAGGTGADPMAFPHHYHAAVMRDFLDSIETGRAPRVNGEEALKVHRLIDAIIAAGRAGK